MEIMEMNVAERIFKTISETPIHKMGRNRHFCAAPLLESHHRSSQVDTVRKAVAD